MMDRLLARAWCAGALLVAGIDARAQTPINPDTIEVVLTGNGCENVPPIIHVVQDGEDQTSFPLKNIGTCRWRGLSKSVEMTAIFSLRLGGTRTECRHAIPTDNLSVAQLTFAYVEGSAHNVEITPLDQQKKRLVLNYARYVHANDPRHDDVETGVLKKAHRIFDVDFEIEDLRLRLPNMLAADPGLLVNDEAVLKELKKGASAVLDDAHVINALQSQARRGQRRFPPTDSVPLHEADRDTVRNSGLKSLAISVVP